MKTSPPNQIFLKALTLIEYDRPKEAIPLLSKFLAQEPDNYEALCYLSSCFGAITEKEKCLHYANQAIQLNPNDAWGYQLQSMAFSELGKYQAGLSAAQAAMRISPQSQSSLTTLMRSYIDCEMLKEAWQTGKKLRSMFPDNAKVFVDIGYILINKKRFDQAEWYLKESLKLDPHCWMTLNNLAVVYENKKMPAKALEYYQLSLQINPVDNLALGNIEKLAKKDVSLNNLSPRLRNHLVAKKAKAERERQNQSLAKNSSSGNKNYIIAFLIFQIIFLLIKFC